MWFYNWFVKWNVFSFSLQWIKILRYLKLENWKYKESVVGDEDVPLVEFMYLVFTRMPGGSYRRRLKSLLLRLCDIFFERLWLIPLFGGGGDRSVCRFAFSKTLPGWAVGLLRCVWFQRESDQRHLKGNVLGCRRVTAETETQGFHQHLPLQADHEFQVGAPHSTHRSGCFLGTRVGQW